MIEKIQLPVQVEVSVSEVSEVCRVDPDTAHFAWYIYLNSRVVAWASQTYPSAEHAMAAGKAEAYTWARGTFSPIG